MKKQHLLALFLLIFSLLTAGCGKAPEAPAVYSSLKEESIRYDLNSLLQTAGVPDAQRAQFFTHIDQFNEIMSPAQLTEGFTAFGEARYDPYDLQVRWTERYPDFLGYNCRITAFSLYGDPFLTVQEPETPPSTEFLEFDLDSIQFDPSAFPGREQQFLSFYSPVPTENTKDVKVHADHVLKAWKDRGIRFSSSEDIRMINMYFHYQEEDRNLLYVGHAGILLPTPDGDLWFVEKLAFQEPYQVVRFQSRRQLQDYLMEKYDLDENQPTARPFILENDALMKA